MAEVYENSTLSRALDSAVLRVFVVQELGQHMAKSLDFSNLSPLERKAAEKLMGHMDTAITDLRMAVGLAVTNSIRNNQALKL